jgi:hypothetical protein
MRLATAAATSKQKIIGPTYSGQSACARNKAYLVFVASGV